MVSAVDPEPAAVSAVRRLARRMIAPSYRRVCSFGVVRDRIAPWLADHPEIAVFSPSGVGVGPRELLSQAHRVRSLDGTTGLVLGAGAGHESDLLVEVGVTRVIGADLEAHPQRWPQRRAELARLGATATFTLMDGGRLGLRDQSVDVVFSQSVLEHVVDLDGALVEAARVLRPGGAFVAWFGPLWSTYGGPHVAELAYDHLLVSDDELLRRARQVGSGWEYWLELGLFNRLRYEQYIDLIGTHFEIEWVCAAGSPDGSAFRSSHPEVWQELLRDHDELDLLIRLVGVVARPRR